MMYRFSPSTRLATLFGALLLTVCVSSTHASAQEESTSSMLEANAVSDAILTGQDALSNTREAITTNYSDKIDKTLQNVQGAMIELEKARFENSLKKMPDEERLHDIANERAVSGVLTEKTRRTLDDMNYKVMSGYMYVPNVGYFGGGTKPPANASEEDKEKYANNPYYKGRLSAIGKLYELQVNLFCNPDGMANPPSGCGGMRANAKINGNENFVDFLLSERTWPTETVLDTMQLARAYFFDVPDRMSLGELKRGRSNIIQMQRYMADTNMRMALLNSLAARRAPTSTATNEVLESLLENFAGTGQISSVDYTQVCKNNTGMKLLEAYVCNMTNMPAKAGAPRIISQAAIDRVMQYDFYLSPKFYGLVNEPGSSVKGSLDKMEVFILAQQITQDYYFLRMLQMKTAVDALALGVRR